MKRVSLASALAVAALALPAAPLVAAPFQCPSRGGDIVFGNVGRDLDDDRPARLAGGHLLVARRHHAAEQFIEGGRRLRRHRPP